MVVSLKRKRSFYLMLNECNIFNSTRDNTTVVIQTHETLFLTEKVYISSHKGKFSDLSKKKQVRSIALL